MGKQLLVALRAANGQVTLKKDQVEGLEGRKSARSLLKDIGVLVESPKGGKGSPETRFLILAGLGPFLDLF